MVKVSHKNVIANVIQQTVFESVAQQSSSPETCLTVIPQSHAATLVMCHTMVFRGDSIIVLPKFDMFQMLRSVQQHQVNRLFLVSIQIERTQVWVVVVDHVQLDSPHHRASGVTSGHVQLFRHRVSVFHRRRRPLSRPKSTRCSGKTTTGLEALYCIW